MRIQEKTSCFREPSFSDTCRSTGVPSKPTQWEGDLQSFWLYKLPKFCISLTRDIPFWFERHRGALVMSDWTIPWLNHGFISWATYFISFKTSYLPNLVPNFLWNTFFCNCYGLRGRSDSYLYTLKKSKQKLSKLSNMTHFNATPTCFETIKKAGNTTWHLLFLGCSSQSIIHQKTLKIEIHLTPWIWENRGCWAQPRCLRQYEVETSAFHMLLNLLTLPKFFKSVVIPTILHHLFL